MATGDELERRQRGVGHQRGSGIAITNAFITNSVFAGNGAGLTNLNAAQLSSGTVPLAQLSGITSNQLDDGDMATGDELERRQRGVGHQCRSAASPSPTPSSPTPFSRATARV